MNSVQRLNKRSLEILESYHVDTDSAIELMFKQVCQQNVEIEKLKFAIEKVETVTKPLHPCNETVTVPPFSRGNGSPSPVTYHQGKQTEVAKKSSEPKVPIRIIGKIDPSEALEEPIGRQGRSV